MFGPFASIAFPCMKHLNYLFLALLCCARALGGNIIAPGETLQRLAGDFEFTEGPASDAEGNVFFTDQQRHAAGLELHHRRQLHQSRERASRRCAASRSEFYGSLFNASSA